MPTVTLEIPFTEQQYLLLLGHLETGHDLGPIFQFLDSIKFSLSVMHRIFWCIFKDIITRR